MSEEKDGLNEDPRLKGGRRGDGGTYLVVADDSDEFNNALRYVLRLAESKRGHIAIATTYERADFVHWGGVEEVIREEARALCEQRLFKVAKDMKEISAQTPVFYIEEGDRAEVIQRLIDEDETIVMLVLAASAHAGGPGPMVTHFTGKAVQKLRVPVLIVPGHIDHTTIDNIA